MAFGQSDFRDSDSVVGNCVTHKMDQSKLIGKTKQYLSISKDRVVTHFATGEQDRK